MAEVVVAPRVERIDAHRDAAHPGVLERGDPLVGQQRAVRADDDRRAASRGELARSCERSSRSSGSPPDRMNIGAGLSARISPAIRRHSAVVSSLDGRFGRAGRDVAVGALEVAAAREVPGDHVRHVVAAGRPEARQAQRMPRESLRATSSLPCRNAVAPDRTVHASPLRLPSLPASEHARSTAALRLLRGHWS